MLFSTIPVTSRIWSTVPRLCRGIVNRAALRPVPPPRGIDILGSANTHQLISPLAAESIATPQDFLKAIGRSAETKLQIENWDAFWKTSGHDLKKAGMGVRDRRYILWCMEKFRLGQKVDTFAHEPRPKKTIRGWGPVVQNGKRIRSRRLKDRK